MKYLVLAVSLVLANQASAASFTLPVGPGETYATLGGAALAEVAGNSYTINMDPGTYTDGDPVVFVAPTVINAIGVTIIPPGPPQNLKGWITTNFPLTVNGLTIIGINTAISEADGGNASAIREQSDTINTLTVNGATIQGFQDGILTGSTIGGVHLDIVTIIDTTFINNGDPNGQTHALYVGDAASLAVTNSTFCGTNTGHDVKSRAAATTVTGSLLFVGTNQGAPTNCAVGSGSLAIDFPNGGTELVDKNTITQGDLNQNGALIAIGEETYVFTTDALSVTRTKFTNLGKKPSIGIRIFPDNSVNPVDVCPVSVSIQNDKFVNIATPVSPPTCIAKNKNH